MSILEMITGVILGLIILFAVIGILNVIVTKRDSRRIKGVKNIYVGKLENTDSSIQSAMQYLELTNGIKQIRAK